MSKTISNNTEDFKQISGSNAGGNFENIVVNDTLIIDTDNVNALLVRNNDNQKDALRVDTSVVYEPTTYLGFNEGNAGIGGPMLVFRGPNNNGSDDTNIYQDSSGGLVIDNETNGTSSGVYIKNFLQIQNPDPLITGGLAISNPNSNDILLCDPKNNRTFFGNPLETSSKIVVYGNTEIIPSDLGGNPSQTTGTGLECQTFTFTDNITAGSGTATGYSAHTIARPTLAATNSSVTTTNANTLYIAGPPIAGTNETITNAYALNVASGDVAVGGDVYASTGTASLPSYSFLADTNTGMYRSAADTLAFTTGGTSRATISTTTMATSIALNVVSTSSSSLVVANNTSTNIGFSFNTSSVNGLNIFANGNGHNFLTFRNGATGASGSTRWGVQMNNTETGVSNAGSDFRINRYDDAGTYIASPFEITRSSGQVKVNNTTLSTSTTTGALVVAGGVGVADRLTASTIYIGSTPATSVLTNSTANTSVITDGTNNATMSAQTSKLVEIIGSNSTSINSNLALNITWTSLGSVSGAIWLSNPLNYAPVVNTTLAVGQYSGITITNQLVAVLKTDSRVYLYDGNTQLTTTELSASGTLSLSGFISSL
jgi:hypothetical protein